MVRDLAELWRFRELLWQLVRRDLKVRYKNSRLGFLWSIAPPLMQVACITFAFKHATSFAASIPSYSAYVLAAMIPWTYFQTAILDSSQSILMMYSVVKKVYMPREIVPLASAISNLIHFLLSWGLFFVYWYVYMRGPILPTIIWLPYLILIQFMLVTGICLLVSCLNVFYEDVKYVATVLLNAGLFLLPVMYLSEKVYYSPTLTRFPGGWGQRLYLYSPLTALINGYRKCLLEPPHPSALDGRHPLPLDPTNLLITGLISFGILVACYAYFNSRKWQFVERP